MIINSVRGDIFAAPQRHIAFAVNTLGLNDEGFAGQVAFRYWPELADTGGNKMGEVLTRKHGDKIFYALVCHAPSRAGGWRETPRVVRECLDGIDIPDDEAIAVVLMGSGPIGIAQGADVEAILGGMRESKRKLVVYTR